MNYPKSIFKEDEVSPDEMFVYYYSNRQDATKAYRNILANASEIPDDVMKQRAFRYLRSDGVRNIMAKNADYEFSDKQNTREAMLDRLIHFANNARSEKVASDSAKAVVEILSKSKKIEVDVSHGIASESAKLLDDIRSALLGGEYEEAEVIEPIRIPHNHVSMFPMMYVPKPIVSEFRTHMLLDTYVKQYGPEWDDAEIDEYEEELL